jgi:hypothetical protein
MHSLLATNLLYLTLLAPAGGAEKAKQPVWLTDYALAIKEAKARGKPIFAVFRCHH